MPSVSKYIAVIFLAAVFMAVIYVGLPMKSNMREGFSVTRAQDCSCMPGYLPQKCGDSINILAELLGGACDSNLRGTYFCQNIEKSSKRMPCSL